jgi:hypothetical protein
MTMIGEHEGDPGALVNFEMTITISTMKVAIALSRLMPGGGASSVPEPACDGRPCRTASAWLQNT